MRTVSSKATDFLVGFDWFVVDDMFCDRERTQSQFVFEENMALGALFCDLLTSSFDGSFGFQLPVPVSLKESGISIEHRLMYDEVV